MAKLNMGYVHAAHYLERLITKRIKSKAERVKAYEALEDINLAIKNAGKFHKIQDASKEIKKALDEQD